MEKIISAENIRSFAYVNEEVCNMPIKGIVLSFFGLGGMAMYDKDILEGEFYGKNGILYVVPYNNPWSWMNKQAVAYTDELIDVLIKKYNLDENVPIVSSGGSMGGQSALVYTAYSKRTPVACVVNCPVCDTVFHFTERKDLPRTLYSAVFNEEGTLEQALATISPVHLADKLPDVNYHIFHCDSDTKVNIESHSEKLVSQLKSRGISYSYDVVKERDHCDLPWDMKIKYANYIVDEILKASVK